MKNLVIDLPENIYNLAGGEAYKVSVHYELVSLLLTSFMQNQYYRSSNDTLDQLKHVMLQADAGFAAKAAIFARTQFGMRSVTHALAASLAPKLSGKEWAKRFYEQIVYRPDDMCRILEYYTQSYGNKALPNALKKGFAKAFDKFDTYQLAKYKNEDKKVSLMDVVRLVHPKASERNQEGLEQLTEGVLKNTATWESMLTQAGKLATNEARNEAKKDAWTSLLTSKRLGYFALLRNLRNIMEQAPEAIELACEQLTSRKAIKKSLVLPFRFDTAHHQLSDNPKPEAPFEPYPPSRHPAAASPNLTATARKTTHQIKQILLRTFLKKSPGKTLKNIIKDIKHVAFSPQESSVGSRKKQQGFAQLRQVALQILQHESQLKTIMGSLQTNELLENEEGLQQQISKVQASIRQIFASNILVSAKQHSQTMVQWSQTFSQWFQLLSQGIKSFTLIGRVSSVIANVQAKTSDTPRLFFAELQPAFALFLAEEEQTPYLYNVRTQVIDLLEQKQKADSYTWQTYDRQLQNYNIQETYFKSAERHYKIAMIEYKSQMKKYRAKLARWQKRQDNTEQARAAVTKAIETALEISLDNVPSFEGKTLIALDVSGSMNGSPFKTGSLFMATLAHANPTSDMMIFDSKANYLSFDRKNILDIRQKIPFRGSGTNFDTIFDTANKAYDRIIILSDMQAWENHFAPDETHRRYCQAYNCDPYIYSFDLAGYGSLQFPESKVCALAGFSENIFDIMKVLEMNKDALIETIEQVVI